MLFLIFFLKGPFGARFARDLGAASLLFGPLPRSRSRVIAPVFAVGQVVETVAAFGVALSAWALQTPAIFHK